MVDTSNVCRTYLPLFCLYLAGKVAYMQITIKKLGMSPNSRNIKPCSSHSFRQEMNQNSAPRKLRLSTQSELCKSMRSMHICFSTRKMLICLLGLMLGFGKDFGLEDKGKPGCLVHLSGIRWLDLSLNPGVYDVSNPGSNLASTINSLGGLGRSLSLSLRCCPPRHLQSGDTNAC